MDSVVLEIQFLFMEHVTLLVSFLGNFLFLLFTEYAGRIFEHRVATAKKKIPTLQELSALNHQKKKKIDVILCSTN